MGGVGGHIVTPPAPFPSPQAELFTLLPDLSVLPMETPPQLGAGGGEGDEAHPTSAPHFRPPPPYLLSAAR